MTNYAQEAREARLKVLNLIHAAQTSHLGSNFSCIDILTVLFNKVNLDQDVFVLSKGWSAASLYYFLWKKGRITEEELNSFCQPGSKFIGLSEPITPDIPIAGGSLGLGLPGAVGIALAKKLKKEAGTVYVLISDGELQPGTTWESALIAAQHRLGNLVVICDNNGLQAMGETSSILSVEPVNAKFMAFGWHTRSVDGHDYEAIEHELLRPADIVQPTFINALTVKGKGWSKSERNNDYHYLHVTDEDLLLAKKEL